MLFRELYHAKLRNIIKIFEKKNCFILLEIHSYKSTEAAEVFFYKKSSCQKLFNKVADLKTKLFKKNYFEEHLRTAASAALLLQVFSFTNIS